MRTAILLCLQSMTTALLAFTETGALTSMFISWCQVACVKRCNGFVRFATTDESGDAGAGFEKAVLAVAETVAGAILINAMIRVHMSVNCRLYYRCLL